MRQHQRNGPKKMFPNKCSLQNPSNASKVQIVGIDKVWLMQCFWKMDNQRYSLEIFHVEGQSCSGVLGWGYKKYGEIPSKTTSIQENIVSEENSGRYFCKEK